MAAKEYDRAIALYQELGGYSDSDTRIQDALYSPPGRRWKPKTIWPPSTSTPL
jgi:hypothetical protein